MSQVKANGDARHRKSNGTPNRTPNGAVLEHAKGAMNGVANGSTIAGKNDAAITKAEDAQSSANTVNLLICVGGIYASLCVV